MPNWCTNVVRITGSAKQVKKFVTYVGKDFDFERFFPCPPELYEVVSPVEVVEDDDPKKDQLSCFGDEEKKQKRFLTKSESQKLIEKFKYNNWYDWCCANWGVKWPASEIHFDEITDTEVQWTFDTPWAPPTGVFALLKKKYPLIDIDWAYQEEGMGLRGVL